MPGDFKKIPRNIPIRATGAFRKTCLNLKEFEAWLAESPYKVVAQFLRKDGLEVFLLFKEEKA